MTTMKQALHEWAAFIDRVPRAAELHVSFTPVGQGRVVLGGCPAIGSPGGEARIEMVRHLAEEFATPEFPVTVDEQRDHETGAMYYSFDSCIGDLPVYISAVVHDHGRSELGAEVSQ